LENSTETVRQREKELLEEISNLNSEIDHFTEVNNELQSNLSHKSEEIENISSQLKEAQQVNR
jgi:hypothetical protein